MNNQGRRAQTTSLSEDVSRRRVVLVGLVGWIATLGVDLFLNAGVFAWVFFEPSPFLLPPEELFVRIPLGYLSFLLITGLVVWLMSSRLIIGWRAGARFGVLLGAVIHGAGVLGMASVSTAPVSLLAAWFVGQTLQTGVVGAVVGQGFATSNLRRLGLLVVVLDIVLIGTTFALQYLALVPTNP